MFAKTLRWTVADDSDRYLAVEVSNSDVVYFAWSHLADGGRQELGQQSAEQWRAHGPLITMPQSVRTQVDELLRTPARS